MPNSYVSDENQQINDNTLLRLQYFSNMVNYISPKPLTVFLRQGDSYSYSIFYLHIAEFAFLFDELFEMDQLLSCSDIVGKQARKPRSYASSKLCPPTHSLTHLLTDKGKV